jgi:hypothetical protein
VIFGIADALGLSGAKALARAVGSDEKRRVIVLDPNAARALEQAGHTSLLAKLDGGQLQCDDRSADALCLSGAPDEPAILRECARAVRRGGRVLMATGMSLARRGPERHLVSALFMHAGLVDIQQRWSRGVLVTTGRVR